MPDAGTRLERVRDLLHVVGLPKSALDVLPRQISGGHRRVQDDDVAAGVISSNAMAFPVRAFEGELVVEIRQILTEAGVAAG